jgi:hypothetical protein
VQRRVFALKLKGIETPEDAEDLRGFKVYILQPPPGVKDPNAKGKGWEWEPTDEEMGFNGEDLYDAATTKFHTHDALEMLGARCVYLDGAKVEDEEALGDFASAETPEAAQEALDRHGLEAVPFGELSAVIPDYMITRRYKCRKQAHDLLDITLDRSFDPGNCNGTLYEPTPGSEWAKAINPAFSRPEILPEEYEQVVYVPFVPDMIARVDADRAGITIYFTLPKGHIQATNFKCRKRIVDEYGRLSIPRGPIVRALLPQAGKSLAVKKFNKKNRPLHGTAPAPPDDMAHPAGIIYPDPPPGVPRPPEYRVRSAGDPYTRANNFRS